MARKGARDKNDASPPAQAKSERNQQRELSLAPSDDATPEEPKPGEKQPGKFDTSGRRLDRPDGVIGEGDQDGDGIWYGY